ncbi:hypothetical protein EV193_102444 [Herbihabitans rhizosphaerae]|uniref:Uncharacterized protein n=1 Tax=Herbihabitans rhizosphaerae TaxID=1872711 RepID=A0A4Q7L2T2_9PSEU|nr:hypothetical protein EV193_102444 [Herbihabitans rhizosphaerae]
MWWQDLFEPATASMPPRHGVHTIRVLIRSTNAWDLAGPDGRPQRTLRPASRLLFRDFRGRTSPSYRSSRTGADRPASTW